ncbi:unnamed protein product [Rotaria socialis]|uniref:Phytanoyl-CoA dioxygenase n=1 Tax=Rotaria socialis TaxID=392032 RepID=A0A818UIQ2_9BILA|nr:unnamed protein product [Rotaria socialis]CAF3699153.1 unnamed protein product [Rotaria socialis]CAF4584560.1 unnamed protein product [Rotaria socialis]CAF4595668.1 unnamed protein product [Rotaria socialis]
MLTQEQIQHFSKNGYLVVEQLITRDDCEKLKESVKQLIDKWDPENDSSCVFSTTGNREQSTSRYFLDSADKISFFMEAGAIDPNTKKMNRDKHHGVNKIGHALHTLEPQFKKVSFSDKVKSIVRDLNYVNPAICQSMYIFKQAEIGAKVVPHQDGSYLFNEPLKIMGIWIALEDATIENGCLWFIPGSQTQPIKRRYIRNPNQEEFDEGKMLVYVGETEQYDDKDFVPVEVKAGDAIVIHGQAVHKSEQNTSPLSRQIYTFHIIEMDNSVYSKENWLQTKEPFPLIYDA